MDCPNCNKELTQEIRKEKYKSPVGVKMAVNLTIFVCKDCKEEFMDEEEQRIYQEKCKNYVQKVENKINKVSNHQLGNLGHIRGSI